MKGIQKFVPSRDRKSGRRKDWNKRYLRRVNKGSKVRLISISLLLRVNEWWMTLGSNFSTFILWNFYTRNQTLHVRTSSSLSLSLSEPMSNKLTAWSIFLVCSNVDTCHWACQKRLSMDQKLLLIQSIRSSIRFVSDFLLSGKNWIKKKEKELSHHQQCSFPII